MDELVPDVELEIVVNNNTQILGVTGNPESQFYLLTNTLYITFDKNEMKNGKLVATNIEMMGC